MPQPAYVDLIAQDNAVVSANGVSGLTLTIAPSDLTVGNFLLAIGHQRPSGVGGIGFSDDVMSVTGDGVWTQLAQAELGAGFGGAIVLWGKHVTGGETILRMLVTAVNTAGNGACVGSIHQFTNVLNPGTATYFEALHVTSRGGVSGPWFDADVQTTGADRLAVNVLGTIAGVAVGVSFGPTGETGGKWGNQWHVTGVVPRAALFTATMSTAGVVGGGSASSGSAGNSAFTMIGFALAPCGAAAVSKVPQMLHHYVMLANRL